MIDRKTFLKTAGVLAAYPALAYLAPPTGAEVVAENALERQTLSMYDAWLTWLGRAGVPGYLGETNTPNSQKPFPTSEVTKWLTLLDKVYTKLDEAGPTIAAVTAHCASITTSGGEGLKVYGPDRGDVSLSQRNFAVPFEQAAVVEAHPPTPDSMRGVNTSAGAFTPGTFGANNPGTYGLDYVYPDRADYEFLASRGLNLVRVPFRWERLQRRYTNQPNADPPIKGTEVARLNASFDAAAEVGMSIIPSVQNYGSYQFNSLSSAKIGTYKLPIGAYAAFVGQLALAWRDHPAVVGYDIMNEPGNMPGASPAGTWEKASQAAVDAIAGVDTETRVWVSGYHTRAPGSYNGLYSFTTHHPDPWITSAVPFGYTTHCYYGPGAGYPNTYDEAVALWASKGY